MRCRLEPDGAFFPPVRESIEVLDFQSTCGVLWIFRLRAVPFWGRAELLTIRFPRRASAAKYQRLSTLFMVGLILGSSFFALMLVPGAVHATTTVTAFLSGVSPTVESISWTQTQDAVFYYYDVWYSTTSGTGPWTDAAHITSYSQTSFYQNGRTPGGPEWVRVEDTDILGSTYSNVFFVQFPQVATLSDSYSGSTTVQLSWNNHAQYGGLLGFGEYYVYRAVNGGGYSIDTTITNEGIQSFTDSVSLGTTYYYYIETVDVCTNCGGPTYPSPSYSNTVSVTTASNTVTEPIVANFNGVYGGSQQTITISGCSANPSTFPGDGTSHSITMSPSCSFSLSLPSGYQFTGGSGTTTCSSGSCAGYSTSYEATPASTVTQSIMATFNNVNGGSQQTIAISNCSPSPSTFPGDGASLA